MKKNKILLILAIILSVVLIIGLAVFISYKYQTSLQTKTTQIEAEAGYAKTVQIKQDDYVFLVSVGNCEKNSSDNSQCNPIKNKIEVKNSGNSQVLQEIELQNINSDSNNYDLYPNLVFEDLNFDGQKDLSIMYKQDLNGLRYFDTYLYNKSSEKFELDKNFSDTISGHTAFSATDFGSSYTGIGKFNADDKVLKVYDKTGSIDTEVDYKIVDNIPTKIFHRTTEKVGDFTKITEGVLKEGNWADETLADTDDGSKFQEVYTNNAFNFQTIYPMQTFYTELSTAFNNSETNPMLNSIEGGAKFYVENFGYDNPRDAVDQWINNLDLGNVVPEEIKHSQYSYGSIYKLSCPNCNGYTNIYFFPHFGLVFNYESESTANAYKDIEAEMVKYMTPTKTLTTSINPVVINSPKQGDVLEVGKTYEIAWDASDTLDKASVQISLIINNGGYKKINPSYNQESCIMDSAHLVQNSGKYLWTVPSECEGVELGGDNKYYVSVFVIDWSTNKPFSRDSGYFTIKNSQ